MDFLYKRAKAVRMYVHYYIMLSWNGLGAIVLYSLPEEQFRYWPSNGDANFGQFIPNCAIFVGTTSNGAMEWKTGFILA